MEQDEQTRINELLGESSRMTTIEKINELLGKPSSMTAREKIDFMLR